jgi:hypothetical protein
MINGSRSSALIHHSGLAAAARAHSQSMAMSGGLHHDGADARVANAPPDPAEGNGAPDDGFATAAWCENVTYSTGFPEAQVARKLYEQWRRSASHQRCMTNPGKNVGAVGVYYDGSTWWATFIAEVDRTPPGGRPASQPAARPAPQQGGQAPPPVATAPPPPGVSAPAGDPAPAPGLESAPEVPVAPVGAHAPRQIGVAPAETVRLVPNGAGTGLIQRFEIDVPAVAGLGNLVSATRTQLPAATEPIQIAGLTGIALIAFRRFERRKRTKI